MTTTPKLRSLRCTDDEVRAILAGPTTTIARGIKLPAGAEWHVAPTGPESFGRRSTLDPTR